MAGSLMTLCLSATDGVARGDGARGTTGVRCLEPSTEDHAPQVARHAACGFDRDGSAWFRHATGIVTLLLCLVTAVVVGPISLVGDHSRQDLERHPVSAIANAAVKRCAGPSTRFATVREAG